MIKNLDDLLSFITLLLIILFALELIVFSYVKTLKINHDIDATLNKWKLFKEYNDNIEE